MDYKYIVGVDCGVKTGYAVWDKSEKKLITVETIKLYQFFEKIHELYKENEEILIRIENPNTWFPFNKQERKNAAFRMQGAGSVKRSYGAIIEFLTDYEIAFESIKLQGTLKKLNAEKFKQITKWEKATSEHGRDAAMMCFGF